MANTSNYDSIDTEPQGAQVNGNGGNISSNVQHKEYLERYQTASSVVIPREVFESMYLSPYNERRGHLRSIFANPTPM